MDGIRTSIRDCLRSCLSRSPRNAKPAGNPVPDRGLVASGTHGLPRQTNDIDILADFKSGAVREFCNALHPEFCVDPETSERAIEIGRPFNVIHMKSGYKFDIFPVGQDLFLQCEIARRRYATTTIAGLENIQFPVSSPEDIILAKLVWFRKGGEVSDRQWHDIQGVVQVQRERLDSEYLGQWAVQLGVSDLLARALDQFVP